MRSYLKSLSIISWEKSRVIWRLHHWFSREMTSEKQAQIFHTDNVDNQTTKDNRHCPFCANKNRCCCCCCCCCWLVEANSYAVWPIRSTNQIWVVTRHQYGVLRSFLRYHFGRKPARASRSCRLFLLRPRQQQLHSNFQLNTTMHEKRKILLQEKSIKIN